MKQSLRIDCTEDGCERVALYRGKCTKHYRQYVNQVKRGETTWAELEKQGTVAKQKRGKDGKVPT